MLLIWTGAAGLLVLAALLALRWYRRRRSRRLPPGGYRSLPDLLMPAPDPARGGRLARFFGFGSSTVTPLGRILSLLAVVAAIVVIVVFLRRVETLEPSPPVYVQTTAPELGGEETRPAPRREITGSQVAVDTVTGTRLVLWSGDDQTGTPGRRLRQLLAVVVTDRDQRPIVGREVRFEVAAGGGSVEATSVVTGESGLAATSWRLGQNPAALEVVASLADAPDVSVRFTASLRRSPSLTPLPGDPARTAPSSRDAAPAAQSPGDEADTLATETDSAADTGAAAAPPPVARPIRSPSWALGGVHTCRVTETGRIFCRGFQGSSADGFGALGRPVWGVAAGISNVCGLSVGGVIGCWASEEAGGRAALAGEWTLPTSAGPEELAVGAEHACARSSAGQVYCWGANDRGQLGRGPGGRRSEPEQIPGLTSVVQLVSGWYHTCALTAAGDAYCWGANGSGQLGDGSTEDRSRPVHVDQPGPFASITAGSSHTCGLSSSGEAWCWGDNQYGALGTGTLAPETRPRQVQTDIRFRQLAAGGVHTCGLTLSGRAWCWGRNVYGQLGNGSTDDSSSPLPVSTDQVFRRLDSGGAHTCAEAVAGGLYCWGNNFQGQLGDGTRTNRTVPVASGGG